MKVTVCDICHRPLKDAIFANTENPIKVKMKIYRNDSIHGSYYKLDVCNICVREIQEKILKERLNNEAD